MPRERYTNIVSLTDHPNPSKVDRLYFDTVEDLNTAFDKLLAAWADDPTFRHQLNELKLRLVECDLYHNRTYGEYLHIHPGDWLAMLNVRDIARVAISHQDDIARARVTIAGLLNPNLAEPAPELATA